MTLRKAINSPTSLFRRRLRHGGIALDHLRARDGRRVARLLCDGRVNPKADEHDEKEKNTGNQPNAETEALSIACIRWVNTSVPIFHAQVLQIEAIVRDNA